MCSLADEFKVELPMPPSVNKLYFVKSGRKHMSSEGKEIKARMKGIVLKEAVGALWLKEAQNSALEMELSLYFPAVENKGWPKKAKSRYKRVDITNRVKLLEDALSEALGIDDSVFFKTTITKQKGEERACVTIRPYEQDRTSSAIEGDGE